MLEIKKECCDLYSLRNELWSEAVNTVNTVVKNDKTAELMELLEAIFDEATDIMTINDFLWFDSEYIYEELGIKGTDN
jgi:UDP-N-acetyl-D-mannosaminuronate dehydrogenase